MKKIAIILSIILLCGCTGYTEKNKNMDKTEAMEKVIAKDNYMIVDVRTKEEYDNNHIKGAINIPYDQIEISTKLDKTKTIMVYCQSGGRSSKAAETLKRLGFDVLDLGAFESIELDKEETPKEKENQ